MLNSAILNKNMTVKKVCEWMTYPKTHKAVITQRKRKIEEKMKSLLFASSIHDI